MFMKFCLYSSTPGLERFSELERQGVWRSTHKRLMQEDPQYRRHVRRSTWIQIWVAIVFTIALFFLSWVLSAARGREAITLNLVCIGAPSVGYILYSIVASFRLQEFMNKNVGKALQLSFGLTVPP
jgi:hypothetical protein